MHHRTAALRVLVLLVVSVLGMASVPASASPGVAYLTVLHGLPKFTADVYVNGKLTLDGFKPGSATQPIRLPAGTYHVAIRNVGDPATAEPVLQASLRLAGGRNYTAVAHLTGDGKASLNLFRNDVSSVPAGSSRLVVRNVADSPALRIDLDGKTRFRSLRPADQADATLPAKTYSIAARSSDGVSVGPMPVHLDEGSAQIVYVIGSASDKTLGFMLQSISDLGSTPTTVLGGTGGAAAPASMPVWAIAVVAVAALTIVLIIGEAARKPVRFGDRR
jgi:hypothetical protein